MGDTMPYVMGFNFMMNGWHRKPKASIWVVSVSHVYVGWFDFARKF